MLLVQSCILLSCFIYIIQFESTGLAVILMGFLQDKCFVKCWNFCQLVSATPVLWMSFCFGSLNPAQIVFMSSKLLSLFNLPFCISPHFIGCASLFLLWDFQIMIDYVTFTILCISHLYQASCLEWVSVYSVFIQCCKSNHKPRKCVSPTFFNFLLFSRFCNNVVNLFKKRQI